MIIRREKNKLPLKINTGTVTNDMYINEALGLFPQQNELVKNLTDTVLEMLKMDVENKQIMFSDNIIKGVNLTVKQYFDMAYNQMSNAEILGIKDDILYIILKLSKYDRLSLSVNSLKHKIASCLSHELNHGYVTLSKYYNSNVIEEIPDEYQKYLSIYNDNSVLEEIRDLAYIYYSTYSFEKQAMIPQDYQELSGFFENSKENITIDNFKKALKNTNTYWTFYTGLNHDIPNIEMFLKNELNLKKTISVFNSHGLKLNNNYLLKKIKKAKSIYESVLKDICRCAIAYYYDNVEKNGNI